MVARSADLATRMVDLLDDTLGLQDARDVSRLLVALFAETVGASHVCLQVLVPDPDRYATLGVLGMPHFASTLMVPADDPGLLPLLHLTEPLWARSRGEAREVFQAMVGDYEDRAPTIESAPPHVLFAPVRTTAGPVGTILLGSGPDGFRLGDSTLTALLARFAGAVLSRTERATIFDTSGRLATLHLDRRPGLPAVSPPPPRGTAHTEVDPTAQLTTRQLQVLVRIAAGATNSAIAEDLGLSIHTVRTHRRHLMAAFEARTSTALVARARDAGVLLP